MPPRYRLLVAVGIEQWIDEGIARWPDLVIDGAALATHLTRLGIDSMTHSPHAADVYLACGCSLGLPSAIALFERELLPIVRAAARKIDQDKEFVDEAAQVTRERLLVAPRDAQARIAEYSGRGPLAAWVRITAMRVAMNLLRPRRKAVLVDDDALFDGFARATDPERRRERESYAEAGSAALRDAFGRLSARERNLLRMHHLHGLTIDEMAPTYRVHRGTIARWIARAREQLLEGTREGLRARLQMTASAADSVLRALVSQLDVSITRLLATEPADQEAP